jgi:hypothetical protein
MQFSVPQFVEIEDKIIGPLTLKQFLILLAGGLVVLMLNTLFKSNLIIFFILALPVGIVSVYLAFGKLNGRPVISSLPAILQFFTGPKVWVFERTGDKTFTMSKKKPKELDTKPVDRRQVGSQLKRLAYLLDQKTAEEERLIHSGEIQKKWLNQI